MEPSPNFRSMIRGRPGILGGLLPDSDRPMTSKQVFEDSNLPPSVGQIPLSGPDKNASSLSPSRASFLNAPASSHYARTPPPAASPSQVWQRPGADYRNQGSLVQTLLDSQGAGVAGGMDASPIPGLPPMPLPPVAEPLPPVSNYPPAALPPPDGQQYYAPPMEAEFIGGGGNQPLQMRPPAFLPAPQYAPLQPSRRYEVL